MRLRLPNSCTVSQFYEFKVAANKVRQFSLCSSTVKIDSLINQVDLLWVLEHKGTELNERPNECVVE